MAATLAQPSPAQPCPTVPASGTVVAGRTGSGGRKPTVEATRRAREQGGAGGHRGRAGEKRHAHMLRDHTLEQHLIVYVCYLARGGMHPPCIQFVELLSVPQGTWEVIYNKIVELMREFEWLLEKVVGLTTNGAASITGVRSGLATRLSVDVPTLITTHCIAHR